MAPAMAQQCPQFPQVWGITAARASSYAQCLDLPQSAEGGRTRGRERRTRRIGPSPWGPELCLLTDTGS